MSTTPLDRHLARFLETFNALRHDNLHLLDEMYASEVVFEDPLHRVVGLAELRRYFARLYEGVAGIRFEFDEAVTGKDRAMLAWTMRMRHRRLRPGEELALPGASDLRFEDGKVLSHRDYFDAGALLYERLPVLGGLVRAVRSRV